MDWRLMRDRLHDWFRWLRGEVAYYVRIGGNKVVNRLGLVITAQYNIGRLNTQGYELACRVQELEAELAHLKGEKGFRND